eukprot:1646724-Karenia_brevis.AAC.1
MILYITKVLLLRYELRVVGIWPSHGHFCLAAPALARAQATRPPPPPCGWMVVAVEKTACHVCKEQ